MKPSRWIMLLTLMPLASACAPPSGSSSNLPPGVSIVSSNALACFQAIDASIESAPATALKGPGLVGARGRAHLKVLKAGAHEVLLPLPQLTGHQMPVSYGITTVPPDAGIEYRLHRRDANNMVVAVRLRGDRDQEIEVAWAAVVLMTPSFTSASPADSAESYVQATACVQAGASGINELADRLRRRDKGLDAFAGSIQEFIRGMEQKTQPRSLDALGILQAGGNWICTANANLAAALLRAQDIPARSLAVIPTHARRLEMHRIVEFFVDGQWRAFDPSSLHRDIPLPSWRHVVMARTTIPDEDAAMKPRWGVARGCPYGQELEFFGNGLSFSGREFFWTEAKSLVEFEPSDEAVAGAGRAWSEFLKTGRLPALPPQTKVAADAEKFLQALEEKDGIDGG